MPAGPRAKSSHGGLSSRVFVRLPIVIGTIGAISYIYFSFIRVNAATVVLTYLLIVLVCATRWGLLESLAASVVAALCLNFFFLAPVFTLAIADPQNWLAFVVFLATSVTVSQLSARANHRTEEILARRNELERLYKVSCAILLTDPSQDVGKQLVHQIADTFSSKAVVLAERGRPELSCAGSEELTEITDQLVAASVQGCFFQDRARCIMVVPLRHGGEPAGALAISGSLLSEAALNALANLVAIGLEKTRAQQAATQAEAARQSQELKSALLDAIAHEFKTPLTSIKAASTALLGGCLRRPEELRELLTVMDEEASRLGTLVTDVVQTARIEAGQVQLKRRPCAINRLVSSLLEEIKSLTDGRHVQVTLSQAVIEVALDLELIKLALRQLVDNAVKYSPPYSPLEITAASSECDMVISVGDRGPGIPEPELPRIFDRFYRLNAGHNGIPGTGIGLAIARQIVEAHGGTIAVANRPGGGTLFAVSLPLNRQETLK
jgi:two-component system sensor histidine kinase KdpD